MAATRRVPGSGADSIFTKLPSIVDSPCVCGLSTTAYAARPTGDWLCVNHQVSRAVPFTLLHHSPLFIAYIHQLLQLSGRGGTGQSLRRTSASTGAGTSTGSCSATGATSSCGCRG